jgi:hypothetical protein
MVNRFLSNLGIRLDNFGAKPLRSNNSDQRVVGPGGLQYRRYFKGLPAQTAAKSLIVYKSAFPGRRKHAPWGCETSAGLPEASRRGTEAALGHVGCPPSRRKARIVSSLATHFSKFSPNRMGHSRKPCH